LFEFFTFFLFLQILITSWSINQKCSF